jgi:hypothetical protein
MNLESILGLLGGGVGVFLLKAYADWRSAKKDDTKDAAEAWQQIADRETDRLSKLENRVLILEKSVMEKDVYIKQLERALLAMGGTLPEIIGTTGVSGGDGSAV